MLTWWCSVLVWTRWTQGLFQSNWFCQLTTRAWSQQLELPPVLTPLMSSSTVVSTRSSSASHLVGLSNTWTRKLSLMHPRILLDFLQLDVLLSWQMPGWLSPLLDESLDASCIWSILTLVSPWSDPHQQVSSVGPVFDFFTHRLSTCLCCFSEAALHNPALP